MTVVFVGGRRVVADGHHQPIEDPGGAVKDAPAGLGDRGPVL
ncbi:MAG: hypothetical protein WAV54_09505 [Acidimicrobiales bacterium]